MPFMPSSQEIHQAYRKLQFLWDNRNSSIPVDMTSCLACEYDANCAAFTTIARATVGKQPCDRHITTITTEQKCEYDP